MTEHHAANAGANAHVVVRSGPHSRAPRIISAMFTSEALRQSASAEPARPSTCACKIYPNKRRSQSNARNWASFRRCSLTPPAIAGCSRQHRPAFRPRRTLERQIRAAWSWRQARSSTRVDFPDVLLTRAQPHVNRANNPHRLGRQNHVGRYEEEHTVVHSVDPI
jgi:hypothetical protein